MSDPVVLLLALRRSVMEDWRFDGLSVREWWARAYRMRPDERFDFVEVDVDPEEACDE